jgi:hypothetical protein
LINEECEEESEEGSEDCEDSDEEFGGDNAKVYNLSSSSSGSKKLNSKKINDSAVCCTKPKRCLCTNKNFHIFNIGQKIF